MSNLDISPACSTFEGERTSERNKASHGENYIISHVTLQEESSHTGLPLFMQGDNRARHPLSIERGIKAIMTSFKWFKATKKQRRNRLKPTNDNFKAILEFREVAALFEQEEIKRLFFHDGLTTKNKRRKRRIEGLRALLVNVLSTLFYYCDTHSLAIGYRPDQTTFRFADYAFLAKKAGCSIHQLKRSMKVLNGLGLSTVNVILKTLDDGQIITDHVEIHLTAKLFHLFGLADQLAIDQVYAGKKLAYYEIERDRKRVLLNTRQKAQAYQKRERTQHKEQKAVQKAIIKSIPKESRPAGRQFEMNMMREDLMRAGYSSEQAWEAIKQHYADKPPS